MHWFPKKETRRRYNPDPHPALRATLSRWERDPRPNHSVNRRPTHSDPVANTPPMSEAANTSLG